MKQSFPTRRSSDLLAIPNAQTAQRPGMSSMRNLKIVILTPDPERFRGAITLAAAQAALGASVSIFLQLEAVALLRRPYGAPGDSAHNARSEEHTSELQSLMRISYAVFCLKT